MPNPLPFSSKEIEAAFPEYAVHFPELGQGSFKVAYKADGAGSARVLKVLTEPVSMDPEDFDEESLPDRLARELKGMAEIDCPNIVKILRAPEVRDIGGSNYLFYEEPFYAGGTLAARLEQGALSEHEVVSLALGLFTAIEVLWSKGIVHRDIKPGNIVFDSDGNPVLLDLGIALYTELSDITDSSLSSPRTGKYAAPEQFEIRRNALIDFRTDVYVAGIVLFEALLGYHPFYTKNVSMDRYFERMETFDGSAIRNVDARLAALIARCLDSKLNRRYRDIAEPLAILEDLK